MVEKLVDVAAGVDYLHSRRPSLAHGDLKGVRLHSSNTAFYSPCASGATRGTF